MKKLYRSDDRQLAGVLGGFAEFLNIDPTIVRVLYVLFGIFANFGAVIAYILFAWLMPEKPKTTD